MFMASDPPPIPPSCSASFISICFSSKCISIANGIKNIMNTESVKNPYL